MAMDPRFDHERLDVYQIALQFIGWVTTLFDELENANFKRIKEVFDHLDRASLSALFNTAEGNGKRQRLSRAKFFDDARGSATECAACLDALVAKRVCSAARIQEGKEMLIRIVAMLTKLVQRFEDPTFLKEDERPYGPEKGDLEQAYRGRGRERGRKSNRNRVSDTRTFERFHGPR